MTQEESIELNPDGTFPWQRTKHNRETTYTTISTFTVSDKDFILDSPKKKTWKEIRLEMLALYILFAAAIGTGWILGNLLNLIIKLF